MATWVRNQEGTMLTDLETGANIGIESYADDPSAIVVALATHEVTLDLGHTRIVLSSHRDLGDAERNLLAIASGIQSGAKLIHLFVPSYTGE